VPQPCQLDDDAVIAEGHRRPTIATDNGRAVMEASSGSADQVFVLRFWRETNDRDRAQASWRVKISHVNSRSRCHAHGPDQAFKLIREVLKTSLGTLRKSDK
jgi:hypothetical protein